MTRGGIERDLTKSPFRCEYRTEKELIVFCFSSKKNLEKFEDRRIFYIHKINKELEQKYFCKFDCEILGLLEGYRAIEHRGFYILFGVIGGVEWVNNLKLDGLSVTINNLQKT